MVKISIFQIMTMGQPYSEILKKSSEEKKLSLLPIVLGYKSVLFRTHIICSTL